MSKIKLLSFAVGGLLLINAGIVAFLLLRKPSAPMEGRPPAKREGPKKVVIERLHLDKDQITSYEAIIVEHQKLAKGLKDSISNTKNALYQSLKAETYTGKDSLINLLGTLQKRIESVHFEHFTQIKKLCKPEQVEDFNKLTNDLAIYFTTEKKAVPPPPPGDQ
jgi:periplasmic protein CpxP/Spy